jgi:hypothetical protein
MTQIPIELVKKYPDSVRKIALKYLSNQPDLLFLRTSSNASPKIISERTLYWMQLYGPFSLRLEYLQKFVSVSIWILESFKQSPDFGQVSPFDRNYRALIPFILQNTIFESLSLPLVHAYSAYYHSRANTNIHGMIISVGEESVPSDDEMIEIHSNASQNGSENKSAHMSDITQTQTHASDQNSQNQDDNSQNQDKEEEEEEENCNGNDPNLSPDNMYNDQVASRPLQDNPPMDLSLSCE